jgi:hypothetical protein
MLGTCSLLAFMVLSIAAMHAAGRDRSTCCRKATPAKHTIGATAQIVEKSWGVVIPARVDTGAHTCSIDAERVEIADEAEDKRQNIGKRIRFLMRDGDEKSDWIETTIVRCATVTTADGKESLRYEVRLTLECQRVRKEVLVTLNDRADLDFPMLVGRNFLLDDFVVDVSRNQSDPTPGQ